MTERIDDGHSTTISFADGPSGGPEFWEKEVSPPGVDGGGPNDTTTMLNTLYRTRWPKTLITLLAAGAKVAYDPAVLDDIIDMVNDNQLITITFPDDSSWAFWGWLDKFTPDPVVEGEQPTANIVIEPSNQNASKVETAPLYSE